MRNFRGEYEVKLDSKNRIQLPMAMRKQLETLGESNFILARGNRRSLTFCPESVWEEIEAKVLCLDEDDPMIAEYRQLKLGGADYANIDANGRLLIPAPLVRHAALSEDVVLALDGNKYAIRNASINSKFFEEMTPEREMALNIHASKKRQELAEGQKTGR